MPPRTKQQKHLQAARSRIGHEELKPADETPSCVHVSADQMVVSTLVSGSHPSMVRKIMLLSNVKPPSMATYYRAQNKILPVIKEVADEIVTEAKDESFSKESTMATIKATKHWKKKDLIVMHYMIKVI